MAEKVISVEHVYKQYRLGLVSTGTISHDLNRWWHRVRGKEDPYEKITGDNRRDTKGDSEYVWALQDIDFDVAQGEVLGIIGKNGAGKSTLLKLLSKVTGPTKGQIKVKGRIASLLEVGTGFHPELTGAENVYLNGAILGMTKPEIKSKFDEIVEFSGVAQYIDTPVKRYSSGMYVRLAFAVAAHLEPEILIVDEVLAVGDADFQKKCLGKMKDVSEHGRTVLFVSHNMASVKSLCSRAMMLEDGKIKKSGDVDNVVNYYLGGDTEAVPNPRKFKERELGFKDFWIHSVGIKNENGNYDEPLLRDEPLAININYTLNALPSEQIDITLRFKAEEGIAIFNTSTARSDVRLTTTGNRQLSVTIPRHFLQAGTYFMDLSVISGVRQVVAQEIDLINFTILPENKELGRYMGKPNEYLTVALPWVGAAV